jgi:hypothetical protein
MTSKQKKKEPEPEPEAEAPTSTTTLKGEDLLAAPLKTWGDIRKDNTLGLPGLGKKNAEILGEVGIRTPLDVFICYLKHNCIDAAFIADLDDRGVKWVGGGKMKYTVEQVKEMLCDTLKRKWDIVKEY